MQTPTHLLLTAGLCLASASILMAQPFDSGSNGSMGEFNPTASTNLVVPPDGVFHFTSVNIPGNIDVGFIPNARNTPVYFLAQSNVVIGGYLDVSGRSASGSNPGRGGPGGFDGGFGPVQGYAASEGQGPGGGKVSGSRAGVFAYPRAQNSNTYGNTLLVPLVGGSGGAGSAERSLGGGGGGGAIVVASSTRITLNRPGSDAYYNIQAFGGSGQDVGSTQNSGGGSGGAVRLVAPLVDGNGRIATGGGGPGIYPGSPGRIRIDTRDRFAWRNLVVSAHGDKWTIGSQMYVFPPGNPRLDIVEAAGQAISEGINNVVNVSLPPGSSTNQIIKVKATGFTGDVPVTVAVVPEAGPSTRFNDVISVTGTNPVVGNVNVVIPVDSFCNIKVWTR